MTKLKDEHMVYMTDDMYLPIHYRGIKVEQPFYSGDGNHSVGELQKICRQFQEYTHQQQVIKQNCMKHIVELKFGVEFPQEEMTFEEAKELARQGIKMTHKYFTDNEYMTMRGNTIIFEDGVEVFVDEWYGGKDYLLTGWSRY